jgi:hypothetical protein
MPFNCSICGEASTQICVRCTKDTCANHLCAKCGRCSDCCECEVPLDEPIHAEPVHAAAPAYEAPDPAAVVPDPAAVVPEPAPVVPEPAPTVSEAAAAESAPAEPEVQA